MASTNADALDLALARQLGRAGVSEVDRWLTHGGVPRGLSNDLLDHLEARRDFVAFWLSLQREYERIRAPRGKNLTYRQVRERLLESVGTGTSMLLTRWGDGEGMALPVLLAPHIGWVVPNDYAEPGSGSYVAPLQAVSNWAWHHIWFGYPLSDEDPNDVVTLVSGLRRAIERSAHVAYYHSDPFNVMFAKSASPFIRSFGAATLPPVIEAIRPTAHRPLSPRWHIELYRDGTLVELLRRSSRTLVVTSKEPAGELLAPLAGGPVDVVTIPTEQGQRLHSPITGARASPIRLMSVWQERVEVVLNSGYDWDLILVGGGLVGKAIAGELAAFPGVVLDIGAVLDHIAGFESRSWMRALS